ncbi:MAG: ABC transporter permease [Acidobacteriota bacterium]|nr:ABC transporter permease [Acidobacteriota bacterium]
MRHALRTLLKNPGFALAAILTLGLGIGANTAVFSVVNGLLLRPLPVAHPEQVVSLFTSDYSGPRDGASSYPDYVDFRDRAHAFSALVASELTPFALGTGEVAVRLFGEVVSGNYFQTLGVKPALGRGFRPDEDGAPGAHPVAVISHAVWQRQFGGDPAIVGRAIQLNGHLFTVVGVAPRGYTGLMRGIRADVWVPMAMEAEANPGSDALTSRGSRGLTIVGRLKPGVALAQARAELAVIAGQIYRAHRDAWTDVHEKPRVVTLVPEKDARIPPALRGPVVAFLVFLMAVVGLVLLVACANVANLLLARATARRREIAIRLALGASRWDLVRQLLSESLVLSTAAGGTGILMARWGTDLLMAVRPPLPVPVALNLGVDGRVLAFAAALSILTGLLFGLAPALASSRPSLVPALKDGDAAAAARGHRSRLRSAFVVAQVALSLVLLIGAGLFLRSLRNASTIDPGFDAHGVLVTSLDLQLRGYDAASGSRFDERLLNRLRALPGVIDASATSSLPLGLGRTRRGITIEGYAPKAGEDVEVATATVGPDYFSAMRIALVRGRGFTDADGDGAPRVVVVNQAFAQRYWPGQDPIGRHLRMGGDAGADTPAWEVVGVARDGKYSALDEAPTPFFYTPLLQFYQPAISLIVRTQGPAMAVAPAVRHAVAAIDPSLPLFDTATLEQHMGLSLLPARLAGWVLGAMGLVALALSGLGLYGAMAYSVAQRTREIGVRMALGADAHAIFRLVIGQGLALTAAGCLIGLAAALLLSRLVSSRLYGISPTDPATFATVAAVLLAAALGACYLPTRRATRVDPVVALRDE